MSSGHQKKVNNNPTTIRIPPNDENLCKKFETYPLKILPADYVELIKVFAVLSIKPCGNLKLAQ